jgi:hypothetical protein
MGIASWRGGHITSGNRRPAPWHPLYRRLPRRWLGLRVIHEPRSHVESALGTHLPYRRHRLKNRSNHMDIREIERLMHEGALRRRQRWVSVMLGTQHCR